MKGALAFLLTVVFVAVASRVATAERTSVLALTHVTVIDGTGQAAQPDQAVLIADGRIAEMSETTKLKIPQSARTVDATGKFLIPGLWDMHVHIAGINADPSWSRDDLLPLLMAYGITGVRDMGGDLAALKAWRSQIAAGSLLGPEIVAAGPMLVGRGRKTAEQYPTANPEEARATVRELRQQGANFIKIISVPSREAFFAIADESKKQGLTFVGHVPFSVTAAEASDAGMKSIEHVVYSNLAFDCSSREEELRRTVREARDKGESAYAKAMLDAIDSYSPEKATALWARFKRNGTWVVPTLESISEQAPQHVTPEARANDPGFDFIPPKLRKRWDPRASENQVSPADLDWWARVFANDMKLTREMHKAGVEILAGSDSLDRFVFPGSSLHKEMEFLVEAGFTPMEALQSATRDAARFLGREKDSGTIARGARADLVLLDANPLQSISNTTKIRAVIRDGAYLDRTALEGLLADAKTAAVKASVPN